MIKTLKAGLLGATLSTTFGSAAMAQEYTTIDLTELPGFTETYGDKLTHGNEDFDLTKVEFFQFDTSNPLNRTLPSTMCPDTNEDGVINDEDRPIIKNEKNVTFDPFAQSQQKEEERGDHYEFNVAYASMFYKHKDLDEPQRYDKVMGPDHAKKLMTEIEGMQWAVFYNHAHYNKKPEPILIAVNTDQGLMVSSTLPDIPGNKHDMVQASFGPCYPDMFSP